jgi:hypothetical protein
MKEPHHIYVCALCIYNLEGSGAPHSIFQRLYFCGPQLSLRLRGENVFKTFHPVLSAFNKLDGSETLTRSPQKVVFLRPLSFPSPLRGDVFNTFQPALSAFNNLDSPETLTRSPKKVVFLRPSAFPRASAVKCIRQAP